MVGSAFGIVRDDGRSDEHHFYDGQQVVEISEPDGMGGYETQKQYVWSLRYVDAPILRDVYASGVLQAGDRIYYLTDANHNVTAVTDIAGAVLERYDYDAYGKVTVYDDVWANPTSTSGLGNSLFFAGQDVDVDTGLQYARARWYSSVVGGFISRDPIGFDAGDANVYRYAFDSPTNYTDPSGEIVSIVVGGALIAANLYVLYHNVSAVQDWLNGQPLDCADDIRTLQYWEGLGEAAALGALLAVPAALAEAGVLWAGAVSAGYGLLGAAGTSVSIYQAYAEYQAGNYLTSAFHATAGVLSQVGAGSYMRQTKEPQFFGVRVAPYGNNTGNKYGQWPHYHRAVKNPNNPSETLPGQGIGRHRPWESKSPDKGIGDRF